MARASSSVGVVDVTDHTLAAVIPPHYAASQLSTWALCGVEGGVSAPGASEARKVNPRRQEFPRLRAAGLTHAQARKRVGADARSATDWDKGITIINRGRVYPDGRVVRYPEPNNGVVPQRRSRAIGGSVDLEVVEKVIHRRYLGLVEREQIQDLRRSGLSIREIASELSRKKRPRVGRAARIASTSCYARNRRR
ncbi:helix-turn-helix domain-containing protein [Nocardia acidivorans]|uniref:helix-turn-helix domain-containing protein n=1 Tax=Nocardia acidivorans TaxID=404580 RepID=UPI001FE0188A|nr:helix-turn-helix domain-containing protein [Nocardia acidivorans]